MQSILFEDPVCTMQYTLAISLIETNRLNAVQGKIHCLFFDTCSTYNYTMGSMKNLIMLKLAVCTATSRL